MGILGSLLGGEGVPLQNEGDILVHDGTQPVALPIGAAGEVLTSDGSTAGWEPLPPVEIAVKEAGASVSSSITTLDFGAGFDVTESPAGEANITLDMTEAPYDNTTSGLTATDVQAAIDELALGGGGGGGGGSDRSAVTALTSSAGVVTVDYAAGDYFTLALTENVTGWTFSNLPGSGHGARLAVRITQDTTARTVAMPWYWEGGVAGVVSTGSGDIDLLLLSTFDNGATWLARMIKDFSEPPPPPETDAYWANVAALLHFNGTDGSTTFTDETGKTWSFENGYTEIDTAYSKFGGGSLGCQSSAWLSTPSHTDFDFGSGEFTVEAWVRFSYVESGKYSCIVCRDQVYGTRGWLLYLNSSDQKLTFTAWVGGTAYSAVDTNPMTASSTTFRHIAAVRDQSGGGDNLRLFVDGVLVGSTAITGSINDGGQPCAVNTLWDVTSRLSWPESYLNGNIDDLRITKGVARYRSNFSPPAAQFPDA